MTGRSVLGALALAGLCSLLPGCTATPAAGHAAPSAAVSDTLDGPVAADVALAARFLALAAGADGQLYHFDATASSVRIHVFRAGRAAALGHVHLLSAPRFEAWLWWAGQRGQERAELRLRLDALQLDDPAERAALGGVFAEPLSAAAIEATRANMLGERGLDAARHPELRMRLLELAGEPPRLVARVEVELHGQRQAYDIGLRLRPEGAAGSSSEPAAALWLDGSLALRQSDFGLQPFSVGGGLLAVHDALLIEFSLLARRVRRPLT